MEIEQIVEIAKEVATTVRQRIPRSSNRFLDPQKGQMDWLKDANKIEYRNFIEAVVRTGRHGPGQTTIKNTNNLVFKNLSLDDLKKTVLDFLGEGRIDGNVINLDYKPTMEAEREYNTKFGTALAVFLNGRGLRNGENEFRPLSAMQQIKNVLSANDRVVQTFKSRRVNDPFTAIHKSTMENDQGIQFPPKYIAASARNAIKFNVGNCEECGCAAFAMLLSFKRANGNAVAALNRDRIRVELVQAKDKEAGAHFFLVLNRAGANNIFADFRFWFNSATVVACDPWINDAGAAAGPITSAEMIDLRNYLTDDGTSDGPSFLVVRATGLLGDNPRDFRNNTDFHLANV